MKTTLQVVWSWLDSLYLKHLAVCDIIISQQRPSTANEVFSTLTKVLSSFGCYSSVGQTRGQHTCRAFCFKESRSCYWDQNDIFGVFPHINDKLGCVTRLRVMLTDLSQHLQYSCNYTLITLITKHQHSLSKPAELLENSGYACHTDRQVGVWQYCL